MQYLTPDQLRKLPKWAQEHVDGIEREHMRARTELQNFLDDQTPAKFYTYTTDVSAGRIRGKRYIAGREVCVQTEDTEFRIAVRDDGDVSIWWDREHWAIRPNAGNHVTLQRQRAPK